MCNVAQVLFVIVSLVRLALRHDSIHNLIYKSSTVPPWGTPALVYTHTDLHPFLKPRFCVLGHDVPVHPPLQEGWMGMADVDEVMA